MLFDEEDAPLFKAWIVKRLENTSDADADVLADYVLALLRHKGDVASLRQLCENEIHDFLKEDCAGFVDDIFTAITFTSYLPPGHPRALPAPPQQFATQQPRHGGPLNPALPAFVPGNDGFPMSPANPVGSRKRTYHDRVEGDGEELYDAELWAGGRHGGKLRRGGRGGVHAGYTSFGGRGPAETAQFGSPESFATVGLSSLPPLPPLDPNNLLGSLVLQWQAMGLPIPSLPNMPALPEPNRQGTIGQPGRGNGPGRKRCRDFDTKGICARGQACPFDHGGETLFYSPPASDDYDPNNAIIGLPPQAQASAMFPPFSGMQPSIEPNRVHGGRFRSGTKGRGTPRSQRPANDPAHGQPPTSIVVENIPAENFTEDQIREFFGQFGEIAEVTTRSFKRTAIVRYATQEAAKQAWSCPRVIFDNRFVKLYWNRGQVDMGASDDSGFRKAVKGEGEEDTNDGSPDIDMEEFSRKQEEAQKQYEERMAKKAELDRRKEELDQLQRTLMVKQREEKRRLQEKLAQNGGALESGDASTSAGGGSAPATDALRAQLAALEAEARTLGIDPDAIDEASQSSWGGGQPGGWRGGYGRASYRGSYTPRGSRGYRARGTYPGRGDVHAAYATYSLDNRPKVVAISGADFTMPEKYETLRHYLVGVGEFRDIKTTASATYITFGDRKTAEKFMAVGQHILNLDQALELAWYNDEEAANSGAAPAEKLGIKTEQGIKVGRDYGTTGGGDDGHDAGHREMDYDVADDSQWDP